jgi:hypothetical protein
MTAPPMADQIRYDLLTQKALRGVVRSVLADAVKKGLPGEHHFYISFDTQADDVRLSQRLRAQYPQEMTIILQHQFWDLSVDDDGFEVGLSFGGVPERLVVPFEAIKVFEDPSVQFTLQFETLAETPAGASDETKSGADKSTKSTRRVPQRPEPARTSVPASPPPATGAATEKSPDQPPPGDKGGAEVVRLDRFRKK